MQVLPLIVLALVACGTDVRTISDDEMNAPPDGGNADGGIVDAMEIPPDGIPTGLTRCEEAAYHSDLAWIQANVFDVSCTTNCHGAPSPAARLSLRAGESRAEMVNVASTQFSGWRLVVPGSPRQSMLMVQIGGESGPELETLMPWGQPKLCDPIIDAIRRWIAAGALP